MQPVRRIFGLSAGVDGGRNFESKNNYRVYSKMLAFENEK
ncbi:hypothetical protein CLOHYLEM_05826 [[Clostridium] hylemonae DSM 15053]|uniref:Uncharacterized protein n=1 Tax=[Clostridium] hylemonae DSM 15053 TaxID=553973 RepID=C0C107_9FIRM|nr:hypothetical protein CLOHYLEM_05826 [[Clostridium] hylemonae DSM 15053]